MALFGGSKAYLDFSYDLRDKRDWKLATIREVEYLSHPAAFAVDATNGLLAVGTKGGKILIFSTPAASVLVRISREVKFLAFASLVFKLICVDDRGTLHIWDLGQLGRPRFVASESFREPITCIATSPYHSHVFIGLERGAIVTYDILCLRRSRYTIPNAWNPHERGLQQAGMPGHELATSSEILDIVAHPRDLNILFLLYQGGVVLYDLTERRALHHYSLIIPPAAPGALGYYDPDVLKPRRPSLTTLAVHASGQLFVTGHIDGTLAFWAVEDEDRPLMVRTIGKFDINYPEGEELDLALSEPRPRSEAELSRYRLEPIFRLAWSSFGSQALSDPYNGDTILTILGGTHPSQQTGVTVLRLLPLVLPPPPSTGSGIVDSETRKAAAKSLSSMDAFIYPTTGTAIDFLSIPKDAPHFGGNLDPTAILLMFEWPEGQRSIDAREFPPPKFGIYKTSTTPASASPSHKNSDNPLDAELTTTLRSIIVDNDTRDYTQSLPTAFWTGLYAVCDGDVVRPASEEYELLRKAYQPSISNLFSRIGREKVAGIAWVNYVDHGQALDVSSTKRQSHRLLVTHHRDLTIKFQDISPQLLIGAASEPLLSSFPAHLPHLTVSLSQLLAEPCVAGARRPLTLSEAETQSAHLTRESSECLIVMRSGHVFVFGFDARQRGMSEFLDLKDDLIRLVHIPAEPYTFQPLVMIENVWGPVTTAEMSDIGFLAVSYRTGALIVVDMRGPKIILRDEVDPTAQKRLSKALHLISAEEERQVISMKWFVCGYGDDNIPKVRLVATHRSGSTRIFTLSRSASPEWQVEDAQKLEGMDNPLPRGTFVLQAKTGTSRLASRALFKEALQGGSDPSLVNRDPTDEGAHCFWVSSGEKGAKCHVNFVGGRAGKVDWGRGKKTECAQVVSRNGLYALVVVMDSREAFVYSLPALEPMHMFQLPRHPNSVISVDDTGDFVDWNFDEQGEAVVGITLGSLFSMRRVFDEPVIDFTTGRRSAPGMPPPVPLAPISYLGSWFNFKKGKNGDAIDELLAGPNRPIPQDADTSSIVKSDWQAQVQNRSQELAKQASQTSSNLYANLSAAVSERGDVLNSLQEQFSSLEAGSKKMMLEAKKLAAEQSGKRWFNF